jgi:tetratricopeptide (TPR) repeat protein
MEMVVAPVALPLRRERRWAAAFWALLSFMAIFLVSSRCAENPMNAFDQANKFYEQGKYPEAIQVYQKLAQDGRVSAALYFNLGNAFFKNSQPGEAIASYRLAQRIAPRDPDVEANLRFARENVGGPSFGMNRWQRWLFLLTVNELTLLTGGLLWLWLLLLALEQVRRNWRAALRPYRVFAGIAGLLAAAWLAWVAEARLGALSAVVVVHEAVVRYGPFDEAQKYFTLRDGAELTVVDHKETWLQVSDASNRTGWLQRKDVLVLPQG